MFIKINVLQLCVQKTPTAKRIFPQEGLSRTLTLPGSTDVIVLVQLQRKQVNAAKKTKSLPLPRHTPNKTNCTMNCVTIIIEALKLTKIDRRYNTNSINSMPPSFLHGTLNAETENLLFYFILFISLILFCSATFTFRQLHNNTNQTM